MGFNRLTKSVLNISGLPDKVQNQASTLKALFDQAGVDIKEALNALIAELEATTAANNIGADVGSVATKTVQAILTAYEQSIADRYTKTELDTLISENTNNLVEDVDINLTTGVITVTKKDGTVETFDTAIEKVPAKFEIVETNGSYALKITNVDGTSTQTDITHLMNIYTFNNSDTINFEVTGEGNEKAIVANIKANSIGLDKLSLTVVSTLEGYMNSSKDSATAAKTSETNARTSEINAANSASTATSKATEATTAANTATTKAAEAQKSAQDAEYWASQAQGGATKKTFTATIPTTGWTTGEQIYVDVTVTGLLESDYPHITPIYTNVKATNDAIKEAWNKIDRAPAINNGLRVYAEEIPTTAIPIQIEVVR